MASKTLSGKVALVTGASRGLGVALAHALASEGADVAISYNASAEKASAVVESLKKLGGQCRCVPGGSGATQRKSACLIHQVHEHFGRDILVNNAAGHRGIPANRKMRTTESIHQEE